MHLGDAVGVDTAQVLLGEGAREDLAAVDRDVGHLALVGGGVGYPRLGLAHGRLVAVVREALDPEVEVAAVKRLAQHGLGEVDARKRGLGVVGVRERHAVRVRAVARGDGAGVVVGHAHGELVRVVALGIEVAHHISHLGGVLVIAHAGILGVRVLLAYAKRVGAGPLERDARLAEVDVLGRSVTAHALDLALRRVRKDHGAVLHGLARRGIGHGVGEGEGVPVAALPAAAREGLDARDGSRGHGLGVIAVGEAWDNVLGKRLRRAVNDLVVQVLGVDAGAVAVPAHDDVVLGVVIGVAGLAVVDLGEPVDIGLAGIIGRREADAGELHVARGVAGRGADAIGRALGHGALDGLVDRLGVKGRGVAGVAADGLEPEAEHAVHQRVAAGVVRIGLVGHEGDGGRVVVVGVGEGGHLVRDGGAGGGHLVAGVIELLGHGDVSDLERAVVLVLDGHLDLIARGREGHAVLLARELVDGVGIGARRTEGDVTERDVGILFLRGDGHVNV